MTRTLQFGRFSIWHPDCRNALRQLTKAHRQQRVQGPRLEAIMSNQEDETGSAASKYLTLPELAKMVRRNRKTVYGWIPTAKYTKRTSFHGPRTVSEPLADVPGEAVQASPPAPWPGARFLGGS